MGEIGREHSERERESERGRKKESNPRRRGPGPEATQIRVRVSPSQSESDSVRVDPIAAESLGRGIVLQRQGPDSDRVTDPVPGRRRSQTARADPGRRRETAPPDRRSL